MSVAIVRQRHGEPLATAPRRYGAAMASAWPALELDAWRATCDTPHAHTQVLGKLAAGLAPPEPQLQHAALRLAARGSEARPLSAPQEVSWTVALDADEEHRTCDGAQVAAY